MFRFGRILKRLCEVSATVAVSELAIRSVSTELRHEVEMQLATRIASFLYEEKIKPTITAWEEYKDFARIYRVSLWVLSDNELEQALNDAYLQGMADGRRDDGHKGFTIEGP